MGIANFVSFDRDQAFLLPPDLKDWLPTGTSDRVSGKLVGQAQLSSGRFAMIDNGLGFQLVPWSDPLEKRLGQQVDGIPMPGGGIDWTLGRNRGLGL